MTIKFDALEDGHGVRVSDTAEGEQFPLRTDRAVDPTPASTDDFTMPVDEAVVVEASELHFTEFVPAIFWQDGEAVHRTEPAAESERLANGTYEVDLSLPGAQLYVRVEDAAPLVGFVDDHVYLDTAGKARLVVGVRSYHETPAGTVTTTADPRDVMAAVSTFGSALKTLSPDRSWPTLRGHPPALELGDELDVPDEVTPPKTGVRIEVPPEYGAIYTVAPLAFYLGATVEPGEEHRLVAADCEYSFDESALAADVRGVLEHVFTLDAVIRSAGVYPFRTTTADELDDNANLDYEALFELPLAERTSAYLDVPRTATEGLLDWHYTAHVDPSPKYAPALPYLVDELALIRSPSAPLRTNDLDPTPNALEAAEGAIVRSAASGAATECSVVVPEDAGTPGQSWIGDGHAVRASNPTVGAYERANNYPAGEGSMTVHVVHNDARLEATEDPDYDVHSYQETSVTVSHHLTTSELREVLYSDLDFLHFVGHVTDNGLVCADGELDLRTLATTGVTAFLLNGCRSLEQGRALLTSGSVGGLVTVDDVTDPGASEVGRQVAMLLDAGFPLYAVLELLGKTGAAVDRYTILGDGTFQLRRTETGSPVVPEFDASNEPAAPDALRVRIHNYPSGENGPGSVVSYAYKDAASNVHSARRKLSTLPRENLSDFLADSGNPVLLDGDLYLTDDLSVEDFR